MEPPLGLGLILEFQPHDVLIDTARSRLYLNRRLGASIVQVDYTSMRVINTRELLSSPDFMDLSDNGFGLELYVPVAGSINMYEAETLSQIGSINTGYSATSVVTDGRGHVFVSPMRVYSRSDGHYSSDISDYNGRLRFLASDREIISIGSAEMSYFRFDSNGNIVTHTEDRYHGDYPLDHYIYRVSPGGEFLITSGSGAIYTADSTMTYVGQLTLDNPTFSDFAFDARGNTIYAGVSSERSILVYEYPSLTNAGAIATWGYPQFVFRDGDRLVCVSRVPGDRLRVGIEVVRIP